MPPTPWTAFTFFGIPFTIGLLGGLHGARLAWRAYRRYSLRSAGLDSGEGALVGSDDPEYSLREQALRAVAILAVSAFLLVHSGRWLLSIYGYI